MHAAPHSAGAFQPISVSDCNARPRTFSESAEEFKTQSDTSLGSLKGSLKTAVGTEIVVFLGDAEPTSRELGASMGTSANAWKIIAMMITGMAFQSLLDEARCRIQRGWGKPNKWLS